MKRLTKLSHAVILLSMCSLYMNCGGSMSSTQASETSTKTPSPASPEQLFLSQSQAKISALQSAQVGKSSLPFTAPDLENQIQLVESLIAEIQALNSSNLPADLVNQRQQILDQLNALLASLEGELAQLHALCPQLPSVHVIAGFLGINQGIVPLNSCPPVPCVRVIAGFLGVVDPGNCPSTAVVSPPPPVP